mmetsp:Transcript_15545/g.34669  ORF Transcript_15545/g.34669 Transcript_15545/m.34669 type:complete len:277 (+) Transcript_15545:195-1025(+)
MTITTSTDSDVSSVRKRSRPITVRPTLQKDRAGLDLAKQSIGNNCNQRPISRASSDSSTTSGRGIRQIVGQQQKQPHHHNNSFCPTESVTTSTTPISPQSYLISVFGNESFCVRPTLQVQDFFVQHTQEQINAYDMEVIRAVRSQDIDQLRSMHKAGRTLQCANRFGESLIHMACRRGFTDVVRFLVDEANVSVKVRDDYGRTPLHDACWTCEPNEELVEFLMLQCPELLLMSDKRGNAPFEYVRTEHWARWVAFLSERRGKICLSHTSTCMVTVG